MPSINDVIDANISVCFHTKSCSQTKIHGKQFFEKPGEYLILYITRKIIKTFKMIISEQKMLISKLVVCPGYLLIINLQYDDFDDEFDNRFDNEFDIQKKEICKKN